MPISLLNTNGTGGTSMLNRFGNGGIGLSTAPPPLLDTYSGASMALSLRKLVSNYTGHAIQVKRSSDNATQNIGFVGTELDTSSLTSFVGSGTGTVVTWYDQSVNGYNATQYTTVATPDIIVSGVLQTLNGKPALYFNGAKTLIASSTPNIYSATKQFISFGVANALDTSIRLLVHIGGTSANAQAMRRSGNTLEMIAYQSTGTQTDVGNINVSTSQFIACAERSDNKVEMWTNNISNGYTSISGTPSGITPATIIGSFSPAGPGFAWNGNMQEIIVFALNPSSNTTYRNAVSTALNTYYTTY